MPGSSGGRRWPGPGWRGAVPVMLSVRDLGCARGGLPVLRGVTFDLAAGQALILRGPNGIGKTTLLRTLAGLQPVLAGQVAGPEAGVAYAGHADGLKASLTVAENLQFWASIYGAGDGDSAGDVGAALAAMQLVPMAGRLAQNLSAGQKRRLGLARLMVAGRALWLLDEPTVSLDAASVELLLAVVRAHLGQGGAALIASHAEIGLEAGVLDLSRFRAAATDDGFGGFADGGFAYGGALA